MTNPAGLIDAVLDMGYGWLDVFGEGIQNPLDNDARNVNSRLDRKSKKLIMSNDGKGMTIEQLNDKFMFFKPTGAQSSEGVNGRSGIGEKALHIKVTNNQGKVLILSSVEDGGVVNSLELDYANIKKTNKFDIRAQEASRRNEDLYRKYNGNSKGTVKILDVAESAMGDLEKLFDSKNASESILYRASVRYYEYLINTTINGVTIDGVSITFQTDDGAVKPLLAIPPANLENSTTKTIKLEMRMKDHEERYYYTDPVSGDLKYILPSEKRVNVGIHGKDVAPRWGQRKTMMRIIIENTKWTHRLQNANIAFKKLGLDEMKDTPENRRFLSVNTIKRDKLVIHETPTEEFQNLRLVNSHIGTFHMDTTHEVQYIASDFTDRHLFHTLVNKSKLDLSEIHKPLMKQIAYHRNRYINELIRSVDKSTVAGSVSVRRHSVSSNSSGASSTNESTVSENAAEDQRQMTSSPDSETTVDVPTTQVTVPAPAPAPVPGPASQPIATTVRNLPKEWEKALGSGDNLQVVRDPDTGNMKFMYRRRIHGDISFTAWVLLGGVRYLREHVYHIAVENCSIEWYVPEDRYDEVVGCAQSAVQGDRNGDRLHIIKI